MYVAFLIALVRPLLELYPFLYSSILAVDISPFILLPIKLIIMLEAQLARMFIIPITNSSKKVFFTNLKCKNVNLCSSQVSLIYLSLYISTYLSRPVGSTMVRAFG